MREKLSASAKSVLFARQVGGAFHGIGRPVSGAQTVAKNKVQIPPIPATFLHYGSSSKPFNSSAGDELRSRCRHGLGAPRPRRRTARHAYTPGWQDNGKGGVRGAPDSSCINR